MAYYSDIDPMDIDPETNRPYSNYSSDALDTSFHDNEMDVDEKPESTALKSLKRWQKFARDNGWTDADFCDADGGGWISEIDLAISELEGE